MSWIQNATIAVICFLLARVIIDADLHHHLVNRMMMRSQSTLSALVSGVLIMSYFSSLFFPNTIIVLSFIPVLKYILERIRDQALRKKIATLLGLALIYGANIGGMGSMIGSPLNLVYLGYIQLKGIPGKENITFFSWLVFGIPATLALLLVSRLILKIGERKILQSTWSENEVEPEPGLQAMETARIKKYVLLFGVNIGLIFLLTAAQFFLKPPKIWAEMNIIDWIFLVYLLLMLFFSFILPRGKRTWRKYKKNILFFFLYLMLFPLNFVVSTYKELRQRFAKKREKKERRGKLEKFMSLTLNRIWYAAFKERRTDLTAKNPDTFVSINRLIADLPFSGLLFMGLVIVAVVMVLGIGDNPGTPQLDGYVVKLFEHITNAIIPQAGSGFFVLLLVVMVSIFTTEFVTNATVVFIMFPLVLSVSPALHLDPLYSLLAVVVAASGAFMTPIATSVNAVVFAGIEGFSLKRMVMLGFLLNLFSGLSVAAFFYLLNYLL
ncbi:MAG: hypothetical protein GTO45_33585 [Candidatus Aminicenantes bacterium]|nr:hypothetical protein [Candidatus Aminicenantes bacterium]NIM83642.1 hypothetical protein [Candidatus Aminicenantes bacterium]NIN23066.1 hypothetical protein [Candidatus Aminicenantes bacterium]NIN46793.1 hypothetical protein [Candidatus Aminicenantes bacterium]NIN89715.1 hypothetical protein [Candidatus Aminicenantes bacterium]